MILPLDSNPVATFLVGLAERRGSGSVTLVKRALHLAGGAIAEVTAAPGDPSFGEFLVQSERVNAAAVRDIQARATEQRVAFEAALVAAGRLSKLELRSLLRACWLDRFVRELRSTVGRSKLFPTLDANERVSSHTAHTVPLLPFVLDAWTRLAADADAAAVGMRIDYRLVWVDGPLASDAQRWASLPDAEDRPVVSTVLGRVPAAAAEIAALVRTGFVKLAAPGGGPLRPRSRQDTLPPPPPRLVSLAEVPYIPVSSAPPPIVLAMSSAPPPAERPPSAAAPSHPSPEPELDDELELEPETAYSHHPSPPPAVARAASMRPRSAPPGTRTRAPRLQLHPGGAGGEIEVIPEVELPAWPAKHGPLEDPLRVLELEVARLEERTADGPQRARAFVQLAALWQTRIGSLEQSTRALREAAAADPGDTQVLLQTARQCGALGQIPLAVAYARTVAFTAATPAERAAGHRALADLYAAQGDSDRSFEALSEAAAEDPENLEPHEVLAQLHYERGRVSLAVAHARRAATGYAALAPKRALGWHALAYAWDATDVSVSSGYRDALAQAGHFEAAVAVSAETARNARDAVQRKQLRLEAAEFARANGRVDLAAELALEVFDEDPSGADPYKQLDADFSREGCELEHLALLECIVRVCPPAQKARWLEHYAKLMAVQPGHADTSQRARSLAQRRNESADGAAAQRELEALLSQLEARLIAVEGGAEEPAVLTELCGWHIVGGDLRRSVSYALRLAALDPDDRLAAARLWRATALRKDGVLSREALTWLARTQSGAAQARSLAGLARQLETSGDFDGALECAEATLASQPTAADAAIVVLRHAHRLAPARAAAVLSGLRTLLGTCPPLSLSLAEAAYAAGAREQALEAVLELNAQMPALHEPHAFLLALQSAHDEPGPLFSAALALLACTQEPSQVAKAEAAVLRLVEMGAPSQAARLAQHILDAHCRADLAYATSAAELARASGEAGLVTLALERVVSMLHGVPQLEALTAVAEHHRERDDRVGEVRAWLRVLSLAPGHAAALEHLRRLFAESGDLVRLLVVLSMGLESTHDPNARRQLLLEMASAAVEVGDDRERAVQYIGALLAESIEDPSWLRKGLGALFAIGEAGWACTQARQLCDALPPEVGAAIYLWLAHRIETIGEDHALALEIAAEGARRFPTAGQLLLVAERLSLATRDRATAVGLYEELIRGAIGDHGRRALAYRAGRWLERTGSYDEALAHYTHAFELAKTTGVAYKALERVARASRQLAPLAQAQETLAELANDDRARVGLLRDAARTSLVELDDPERGFRNLLKADALVPVGELDGALTEAAQRMGERDQTAREQAILDLARSREARAKQLWDGDPKAKLLASAARLHLHERRDFEASAAALTPLLDAELAEQVSGEVQVEGLVTLAEAQLGAGRTAEAMVAVERALSVAPGARHALELKERLSMPPAPRLPPQASAVETPDSGVLERMLERVRGGSADAAVLRELYTAARAGGAVAEASVAAQILSIFDRSVEPPDSPPSRFDSMLPDEARRFVHGGSSSELRSLTRMLWECVRAVPQLRRTPESFGLDRALLASPDDRAPVVGAFGRVMRLLGQAETELYLRVSANPALEVLPTHPPCIVAYANLSITPTAAFRIAQSVVFAEPEHTVTCVLPEPEGQGLVAALLGAFGPPGSAGDLGRSGKELASQLWHSVPVRVQAQLRELVRVQLPALDYERMRADAMTCAYRAGLLTARDLRTALESFVALQLDLTGVDIHIETGFDTAYARSSGVRELVRAAFSEAYLSRAGRRAA